MTLARLNKILEIFWWTVAAITLIVVIIMIFVEGADKWLWSLILPAVAVLAALMRRFAAKRLAKSEQLAQQKK